jgi:predicted N-acyltransferase
VPIDIPNSWQRKEKVKKTTIKTALTVKRFQSIHDIQESLWNSINSDNEFFHDHRFIQSIEDAGMNDCKFWYLLFYSGTGPVGSAALSAFKVSLDLFLGAISQKLIRRVRRLFAGFFKIDVLFCGLPISIGKYNLVIADPSYTEDILSALVEEMTGICRDEKIKFMCVKEFYGDRVQTMDRLVEYGFFRAPSLPYVRMPLHWSGFEDYLNALRHTYRRQIKNGLKKMSSASPGPVLILGKRDVCSARQFFELYREVMEHAGVQLEILNQSFFEHLFIKMHDHIEILVFQRGSEVLGAALLCPVGKTLTFLLVGLDYSKRDDYDVYFNLIYGIIKIALERGCSELNLGQTSYYIKQRIGGTCIPAYFYLKSLSPPVHSCLKILRKFLFPELNLPIHNVFH